MLDEFMYDEDFVMPLEEDADASASFVLYFTKDCREAERSPKLSDE